VLLGDPADVGGGDPAADVGRGGAPGVYRGDAGRAGRVTVPGDRRRHVDDLAVQHGEGDQAVVGGGQAAEALAEGDRVALADARLVEQLQVGDALLGQAEQLAVGLEPAAGGGGGVAGGGAGQGRAVAGQRPGRAKGVPAGIGPPGRHQAALPAGRLYPAAAAVEVGELAGLALEPWGHALGGLAGAGGRRRQRGDHQGNQRAEEERRPPGPPGHTHPNEHRRSRPPRPAWVARSATRQALTQAPGRGRAGRHWLFIGCRRNGVNPP
jgi:hypothetical protein